MMTKVTPFLSGGAGNRSHVFLLFPPLFILPHFTYQILCLAFWNGPCRDWELGWAFLKC